MDGNRTSYSDTTTAGTGASATPVTVSYCYDLTDRLVSDTVAHAPTGAGPLLASNLTSANLVYDSHGDDITLADETMTYDQVGRHLTTTTTGSSASTVTYVRDVTDRIVAMTTTGAATNNVRYSSTPSGLTFTLNTSSLVTETSLSLPGGVTYDTQTSGTVVWSFPDLHGDDVVTTDGSGTRIGGVAVYDPFGDPINLVTGLIGALTANAQDLGNTSTPGATFGWEGSHDKQYQHTGDIATIEMGARQYVPILGRFLSVDPVPGGNANDYNYPNDPINDSDVTGNFAFAIPVFAGLAAFAGADFWNPAGWVVGGVLVLAAVVMFEVWANIQLNTAIETAVQAQILQAKGKTVPRGSPDKTIRDVRGSGKDYPSEDAAVKAAKKDAANRPNKCVYRGKCSSGDHVHVETKNGPGKPFVRHYYW